MEDLKSRHGRDDRPERSSAEWYAPTPMLVKLANAEEALAEERARGLAIRALHELYPNGLPPIVIPSNLD